MAFRQGWIVNEEAALAMMDDRNLTSHTYNEDLAHAIYLGLPAHAAFLKALASELEKASVD